MARHQSYGERMSEWEHDQDERNWKRSLERALLNKDQELIEELVKEGIADDYSFSDFDDPVIDELRKHLS